MRFYFLLISLILTTVCHSQSGFESILLASESDSKKIYNRYLNPLMKGAIYSSNSGWYNTAKVHKKLGFDLSFRLNTAFVPKFDRTFYIDDLESVTTDAINLPTIAGKNRQEDLLITIPSEGVFSEMKTTIKSPGGIKSQLPFQGVPATALQLGIGVPFDTEFIFRYSPGYHGKGVEMDMIGFGVKHNLLQYFGPIDKFPFLNISALASFSKMKINYDIQSSSSLNGSSQIAKFNLDNYNFLLLASLDLPIVKFYSGIGLSGGNSSFKMLGQYDLEYLTQSNIPIKKILRDPVDMNFNNSDFQISIGAKYKFFIFNAFLDFTFQEYNTLSMGISTSFR